jgi:hypothetical protein
MLELGKIGVCGVKTVSECHRVYCGVFRLLKEVNLRRILTFCSLWEWGLFH